MLIALQFVTSSDRFEPELVGWCQGGPCSTSSHRSGSRLHNLLDGNSHVDTPRSCPGPTHQLCSCCVELLKCLGGQEMLSYILQLCQPSPVGEGGTIVTPPMFINGTPCHAVRANGTDSSWGVVSSEGALTCFSCDSGSRCSHMPLVPGYEPVKVQSTIIFNILAE